MIDLNDISLALKGPTGPVKVLKGVNLYVEAGEIVSVVGPSGSGKSSMMMIIAGLERPTGGTVKVDGTDLAGLDEDGLALFRRDKVGIVFQNFHLVPTMTALENVATPLEFAGRSDAFERAKEGLTAVGLEHRLDHFPGQLSGGEQQRVALARAFSVDPALILADEPTGNLDGNTGEKVIELLFDIARRRKTSLVLITHDAGLAARCDRTVKLVDGLIVDDGRTVVEDAPAPEPVTVG
ncbi:MAG: ABC transporter ATP-binding protein [Pseudomonadota bacterium]